MTRSTLLLVDDEPLIRTSAARMLKRLGYSVLLAEDGLQALEVFQKHGSEIALVILDLVMPMMDGADTFVALKKLDPAVKVLFTSGYLREKRAEQMLAMGAAGFVQKPFKMADLSQTVQQALSREGSS